MITSEDQRRSTVVHLRQFEEARTNLEAAAGAERSTLQQLEIDAVVAQADALRAEVADLDRLSSDDA